MRFFFIAFLCAFCLQARAEEQVIRTTEIPAAPLQCWRALCEDWIFLQWSDAQTASFGGAPELTWRVQYDVDHIEEGVMRVMDPGKVLEYSYFSNFGTESIRFEFTPTETGTKVRLLNIIPADDVKGFTAADGAGRKWEIRLHNLKRFLSTRPNSYYVGPPTQNPYPAVLLLHDRFGLTKTVRDFADSLATRGYRVLAVDMFRGDRTSDMAQARDFVNLVNRNDALMAIGQGWRFLIGDSAVNSSKVGVVGIGFGGEMALAALASQPALRAAAAWYPDNVPADSLLLRIAAPVLMLHAAPAADKPTMQAEAMTKRLVQQGVRAESLLVRGDIGFAEPANGAAYSGVAYAEAFRATMSFLDRRLKL